MVDEQWQSYPTDYERFITETKSCFRCLGFLLKYGTLTRAITGIDVTSGGGSTLDEKQLYGLALAIYNTTSMLIGGIPERTPSALPV